MSVKKLYPIFEKNEMAALADVKNHINCCKTKNIAGSFITFCTKCIWLGKLA